MLRGMLALLLTLSPAFAGDPITGMATVLDGDTLELQGSRIDLYGIDAPEASQICAAADGARYACGQAAATALRQRIGKAPVSCMPQGIAAQDHVTAMCRVGEIDLSAWMAVQGYALALRDVSPTYVAKEARAWGLRRGLWAGVFDEPVNWRHAHRGIKPEARTQP